MTFFLRCLAAEIYKSKRTIALAGIFLLPTILSLFNFFLLIGLNNPAGYYATPNGWLQFEHNTITFWALLVFPYGLVLVSAFSAHQEHDIHHWRQTMCLPLPKAPLYLAKLALVMGLSLLSCLVLWVENIGWGWLFSRLRPELGLSLARITLGKMLVPYLWIYLFSLLILAIHFWFSMRAENFVLSIGAGFALGLLGAFLHEGGSWSMVFPWSLPPLVYTAESWAQVAAGALYSLVGFAAVAAGGCRSFTRRDVLA
jgi:ABC-2 type transport system permease protein